MRCVGYLSAILLASLAIAAIAAATDEDEIKPATKGPEGLWQGTLKAGPVQLRFVIKITKKADGTWAGSLDSLDEGLAGLTLDSVAFKDGAVRLELKKTRAVYEGQLKEDGSTIVGHWKQLGPKLPLTFTRITKAPQLARPQHPKRPYPYAEHEVTFENEKAGVKLAGTLTVPRGQGPFPAVVLLSGSGPQDRDETIFGHKPFLVLADHLTRHGIAVLRLDDRGVGGSTGDTFKATLNDLASDALTAVAFLKARKQIDPAKIGLVGHSEGGLVAPLVASQSKDVAFIVLLAGTGLPGEDILYLQGQAILKALGLSDREMKQQRKAQELIFTSLKEEPDDAKAKKLILKRLADERAKLTAEEQKASAALQGLIEAQLKVVLTPWFRFFLTYDPRPALRKVEVPVLVLIGEKDLQVPPKENLQAIGKALDEGGNKDHTVMEMPGLNHLFQTSKTGSITEYGRIEETFAPAALAEISSWIRKHTGGAE
jgi:fermentation-respiration switch protein FrsA (DUF1100 family)